MDDGPGQLIPHGLDELARLQELIDTARLRLAAVESECTLLQRKLQAQRAAIFQRLAETSKLRDKLRLRIRYLADLLEGLRADDEEMIEGAAASFQSAWSSTQSEYAKAEADSATKRPPNAADEAELATLWRKLVKLYHPDKLGGDDDLRDTYHKLISAINHARDAGDVATLREIASDPNGFVNRKGWARLETADQVKVEELKSLLKSLQAEIVKVNETLSRLKRGADYELLQLVEKNPAIFEQIVEKQLGQLEAEMSTLRDQTTSLSHEIERLTGEPPEEE